MACIGLVVGIYFMNVFSTSSDALLHCFVLDEELSENGKATHNPPEELQEFITNERDFDPRAAKL